MSTNINLGNFITEVKQYPYRHARVINPFIQIDRHSDDARAFEEKLAELSESNMDNHTTYELVHAKMFGGDKLYVFCSDSSISIGTQIVVGRW